MTYEPRGRMIDLLAALRAEPQRIFRAGEVSEILHCKNYPSTIDQYLYAATGSGLVYKRKVEGSFYYAGSAISDELLTKAGIEVKAASVPGRTIPSPTYSQAEVEAARTDVRAPKVDPTWTPPKMVAPRAGSDLNIPKFVHEPTPPEGKREAHREKLRESIQAEMEPRGDRANRVLLDKLKTSLPNWEGEAAIELGKRTTSAATASSHEIPDLASTPEPVEAAGPGQEQHQAQDQHPAGSQERCGEVANEGDARVASGGCAQPDEEEDEAVEFNAAFWLDGEVVIYGAQGNEDGSFTLTSEQVDKLGELFEVAKLAKGISRRAAA